MGMQVEINKTTKQEYLIKCNLLNHEPNFFDADADLQLEGSRFQPNELSQLRKPLAFCRVVSKNSKGHPRERVKKF